MPRPTGPMNPILRKLVRQLREKGKEQKVTIWLDLAERLMQPRRVRAEVNLSHIRRYSSGDSTLIVPGKVLGAGKLDRPLSVAAFKFSGTARRKITGSGGKALTIQQLLEQNPSGSGTIMME
jgi:large subunit ribosomal protein L18e